MKIPHAVKQLSLCVTTTEPVALEPRASTTEPVCSTEIPSLEPVLCNREATTTRSPFTTAREDPSLATARESPHGNEDPMQTKINK